VPRLNLSEAKRLAPFAEETDNLNAIANVILDSMEEAKKPDPKVVQHHEDLAQRNEASGRGGRFLAGERRRRRLNTVSKNPPRKSAAIVKVVPVGRSRARGVYK
jgi:hypothetical protein